MESARRPHYQVTFGILAIGIGAFALLQSLVIPVLTTVQAELHTSQSAVTWVLTAYLLSASVMTPILGRVGDMFGKKWVFVATLVALAVGSVLAAVAPNLAVMIVARVIQGLAGGMLPLGFGIIRDEFPGGEGGRRRRHPRGADRGRRQPGDRAGRPDRERAQLALAVLAAGHRDGDRGDRRGAVRPAVPGPQPGHDQLAARRAAVRLAGGCCWCR